MINVDRLVNREVKHWQGPWWEGYCLGKQGDTPNFRWEFCDAVFRYRPRLLQRPQGRNTWNVFKNGVRDGLRDHAKVPRNGLPQLP